MPVQNTPQRARKSPARRKSSFRLFAALRRWPRRRVVLAGVIVIAATVIAVNALVLQSARHPAPLFAAVEKAREDAARRASQRAAAPTPPARPAAEAPAAPVQTASSQPAPAAAPAPPPAAVPPPAAPKSEPQSLARLMADVAEKPSRPAERAQTERGQHVATIEKAAVQDRPAPPRPPARGGDALGELIRGGIVPPGGIPSEPDPRIMQAQRGLARSGAAGVKPDGFMGPATRAAIEKFEREHKWPVTGEVSARLLRELGVISASRP